MRAYQLLTDAVIFQVNKSNSRESGVEFPGNTIHCDLIYILYIGSL